MQEAEDDETGRREDGSEEVWEKAEKLKAES
jgi:hypothetical protein